MVLLFFFELIFRTETKFYLFIFFFSESFSQCSLHYINCTVAIFTIDVIVLFFEISKQERMRARHLSAPVSQTVTSALHLTAGQPQQEICVPWRMLRLTKFENLFKCDGTVSHNWNSRWLCNKNAIKLVHIKLIKHFFLPRPKRVIHCWSHGLLTFCSMEKCLAALHFLASGLPPIVAHAKSSFH